MFKNVVVGVDDGDGGRDAVALAKRLVAQDGELTLAHIFHHTAHGAGSPHEASEYERFQVLLEKARDEADVDARLRWRGSSSVGRGLHELAELVGGDLLVVGSTRRGLLGRVLIGDDTRAALNGAPCAVAIAPTGYSRVPVAMREIGVAYDGSPESRHALGIARTIATGHRTKLSAFQAVSTPAYAYVGSPAPIDAGSIEQRVEDAREKIAALGGVEPHSVYGDPVEELTVYSASLDLLVVGSRGYGPLGRLVYGGVAQRLARTARCPLLVLTRASRTAAEATGDEDGRVATASAG